MLGDKRKIHFVGIGGIGMSGIAELLYNLNHIITGSDIRESDRTRYLEKMGVKISIKHSERNIVDADIVVYSSAVNLNNPEIIEAKVKNIPVIRRAEMLAELARLMTLMSAYLEREEYEKCAIIKNKINKLEKKLNNL